MGVTPSAHKTFPAVAKRMAFVTPDQVVGVAEAIVKVQRDFGNRADRKVARIKYLISQLGHPRSSRPRSRSITATPCPIRIRPT